MTVPSGNNPGFTLAEDAALKARLSSVAVTDDRSNERLVQTFFRHPENPTEKTYPFLTLELIDIRHAVDRQHSERELRYASSVGFPDGEQASRSNLFYYPSEKTQDDLDAEVPDGGYLITDQFVPVDLIYQIETHARNNIHDRQMTAILLRRVLPFRRGFLYIPEDDTQRRLTNMGWTSADILDQETGYKKRIFRKVYTVSVSAELPAADFSSITRAISVHGTVSGHTDPITDDPFITEEFS